MYVSTYNVWLASSRLWRQRQRRYGLSYAYIRIRDVIDRLGWLQADNMYDYHRLVLMKKMLTVQHQTLQQVCLSDRVYICMYVHIYIHTWAGHPERRYAGYASHQNRRWETAFSVCTPRCLVSMSCRGNCVRCKYSARFKSALKRHLIDRQRELFIFPINNIWVI